MDFLINVKRISPQHKINGLISEIPNFIDEMEHYEKLKSKIWPMTKYLSDIAYIISIVLNVLILFTYEYVVETQSNSSTKLEIDTLDWTKLAIFALGIAQVSVNSLVLISWLAMNFSLMNKKSWRDYIQNVRTKVDPEKFKELESRSKLNIKKAKELPLQEARSLLAFYGKEAKEFNLNKKVEFGHLIVFIEYYWLSLSFIIQNKTFRYYSLFILFAVFGLLFSPAFFSFHLLDIVRRSPTLQDVIKSVTNNIEELALTGLLGLIIIYIFSTFGFAFFYDMYYDEEVNRDIAAERGQSICKDLFN